MIDLNAEIPSTVIDNDAPVPGGAEYKPDAPQEPAVPETKPMSLEDAVKQAAAETKVSSDKDAPAPKEEVKAKEPKPEPKLEKPIPDRGENGKFKPRETQGEETPETSEGKTNEAGTVRSGEEPRPSEGREDKPPAQFLPRAKEAWSNADPDIRSEVKRMEAEFQRGKEVFEDDRNFRKELREFEDMAKGHNTTVKDALSNYVAIDNLLKSDPVAGVERILKSIGITPEQYAQHIMNAPQRPAADPSVSRLEQTVQQLQRQLQEQQQTTHEQQQREAIKNIEDTLFNEVREKHPRFDELRTDIAFFWNSDKLSSITDERQRLFAATDMAERINPGYAQQDTERLKPATDDRPLNPAGTKSVKGSLSYGAQVPRKSAKVSLDEAIAMAARSVR